MIITIEIIKALTLMIREHFPKSPINDRDLSEGFNRPCCFITADDMTSDEVGLHYADTDTVVLTFFAERRETGFLELLKIKNKLRVLLGEPLEISEFFHLTFDDITHHFDKKDMVLETRFSVYTVRAKDDDYAGLPDMNEVIVNVKGD